MLHLQNITHHSFLVLGIISFIGLHYLILSRMRLNKWCLIALLLLNLATQIIQYYRFNEWQLEAYSLMSIVRISSFFLGACLMHVLLTPLYCVPFIPLIQIIFFVNAWFLYRDLGWTKQFVSKVTKYLSLAWLLGIEVWAFLLSRCLYEGAGQVYQQSPWDTPIYIPYVWSLDNAQFRLDLNHALLVVSVPLSIAVLAWCHKRYTQKRAEQVY
jgi:hypothetical protein